MAGIATPNAGIPVSETNVHEVRRSLELARFEDDTSQAATSNQKQPRSEHTDFFQTRKSLSSIVLSADSDGEEESSPGDQIPNRLVEKDFSRLVVLMIHPNMQTVLRSDLNRYTLLSECVRALDSPSGGAGPGGSHETRFGHSDGGASQPDGGMRSQAGMQDGTLHLRDVRFLQGGTEPALLVRRGAIVVSLNPINAIITHSAGYMLVPNGSDSLLAPLLERLRAGHRDTQVKMPFELIVLEAFLITLVSHHMEEVKRSVLEAKSVLRSIRKNINGKLLNKVLSLKRKIHEVHIQVSGVQTAIEETQKDDDMLALMYLTETHKDPEHVERVRRGEVSPEQAELLLDAYALEFESMALQLHLVDKEIDATEDLLKFKLDTARNKLIKVDVSFGIMSMWFGACALITGYYGQNMQNGHMNDTDLPWGPWGPSTIWMEVAVGSGSATIFLIIFTLMTLWCCGLFRV